MNNKLISDPIEVANSFSKYFSTVSEKLQSSICHNGQGGEGHICCDFSKYLTNMTVVIDIINDLNSNKAM